MPKRLTNLVENKENLVPYGTIGYKRSLDTVLECFREALKALRNEKIKF
ncbi:MAG: hypothetical protein ACFE91_02650 [Promethearchaeota archaeon]